MVVRDAKASDMARGSYFRPFLTACKTTSTTVDTVGWWRYNQRRKAALIGLSVLSSLGATVAGILDSTGLHYKPLRFYNRLGFPQLAKVQSMRKPCQQMA